MQLLAVHVPGVRNCAADRLSRIAAAAGMLREIREMAHFTPVEVTFPARGLILLRAAALKPHRDA